MLKYLQIENFKSIRKTGIPLEKLNLFFGMNGMGKSSVIQSLLLLRQSYWARNHRNLSGLNVSGELINLGTSADILCQSAETDIIRFFLCFQGNKTIDISFRNDSPGYPTAVIKAYRREEVEVPFAEKEPLFGPGFCYLSADHIGPQTSYSSSQWDTDGINRLGSHGEYTVPFIALQGNTFQVPDELCLTEARTDRLFDQVSAWMSSISSGVKIYARNYPYEQLAKLDISYEGQRLASNTFLPVNVGFGIPYVLPLVVALLTAEKDGLLLIENPESHLHPKGQTAIAELISRVAARGTQIICESHSDHIINGVRVAVKNRVLENKDVSVVYFDKDDDQITRTTEISVDQKGNLSDYPAGLLDEWGILMSALI